MSKAQTGGSRPPFPEKQSLTPPSDTFGLSAAGEDWPFSATDEAPVPSPTKAAVVTAAPSAILNCREDTEAGSNSGRSVASFLSLTLPSETPGRLHASARGPAESLLEAAPALSLQLSPPPRPAGAG